MVRSHHAEFSGDARRRRARAPGARTVLALGALLLAAACAPATAQSGQRVYELDRIVAVVNDDVIVASELQNRLRTVVGQLRQSGTPLPPPEVLTRQVLERLVLDRLQLQLAQQSGISVDEETLNRSVAGIARQNQLSLREFRDILERDGYDFGQFRENIRDELLISQVRQRFVNNRVTVSQRDIDNHLATAQKQGEVSGEYRLGHILISVPEGASPEQIAQSEQLARRVLGQLRDGADFAQLAATYSDGQQALQGGDLSWRRASELPTFFGEVAPRLAMGEVSEPLRSPSGFHLIKLLDSRGAQRHVITQTQARHILIRPNELTSAEDAQVRLSQLRERIINGENFAELARAHSDDTASAATGGDLGWVTPGAVLPDFQQRMDTLAPGQVSEPFETQFGWHIVQVVARRDHDDTEEVRRANAREQIRRRKVDEELQTWLRQIRDEAYVEYRLDE